MGRYANFVPEFPVKYYDVQNKHILPWTKLIYYNIWTNNYHKTCLTGSLWLAPRRLLIPGYPERNGNTKPPQWYQMLTLFANCNLIFFIFVLHAYYTCHNMCGGYRNTSYHDTFSFVKYHDENFSVSIIFFFISFNNNII